ncbi:MAG: MFS transporter [Chakrabartia sp.]
MTPGSGGRAFGLLGFFLLLHILNQVDRNLIASFGPDIQRDLGLSLTQFGVVTGIAFTAAYAFLALGAGVLADRFGRVRVMAGGLAIWSGFTALSGMARSFGALVGIRPLVAAGEATLIPTATAILSEQFSADRRATAIGLFFIGVPLGVGASFFVAGWLGPILGWRGVFLLLGLLGVLLVPVVLRLKIAAAPVSVHGQRPRAARDILADLIGEMRRNAEMRLCLMGTVLMHVHLAGVPFIKIWLAAANPAKAASLALDYGIAVILLGIIGAGLGGVLADAYARRWPGGRAAFLALFVALLAPFMLAFRLVEPGGPLFFLGMGAGVLFFSAFYGPAFAVLQSVTPQRLHASVTGLSMLLVNIFALGLGSLLIGAASDHLAGASTENPLTVPLIAADGVSLLTLFCYAAIAWRTRHEAKASQGENASPA